MAQHNQRGRSSQTNGHGHEWNSQEAAEAGRKGGAASHHQRAAFHHETAAHHHTQAAQHHAAGRHAQAQLHADSAMSHGRRANEHAERANEGRGFAGMDPDRQREISAEGGRASHGNGPYNGQDDERMSNENDDDMDMDEDEPNSEGRGSSSRGGNREQHAEAGRRGAEARRSSQSAHRR